MAGDLTPAPHLRTVIHGDVVLTDQVVRDGAVVMADGRIAYAGPRTGMPQHLAEGARLDAVPAGTQLLPGLVDLHCHGGGAGEFGGDPQSARRAVRHHHRSGTTSVVASLVSAPPDVLLAGMRTCAALVDEGLLAAVHTEGPFLAPLRSGAQDPRALRPVDLPLVDALVDAATGHWSVMTFAPELADTDRLVKRLADAGVVPAVGHTDSDAKTAARILQLAREARGGRPPLVTHLFNAMPPLHHRAPGPVAACLSAAAGGDAVVELIADGAHLADSTVSMVMALSAPHSVVLVTDAMSATGMPDGRYTLGALDVVVADRIARLADGGSIAGGTATLLDVVRRCVVHAGVDLRAAVRAASANPAAVLGMEGEIGALTVGSRADVLAVDAFLHPVAVWRRGARLEEWA